MKKKRLKARVKTRLMLILAFLLFCGMGVTLWAGKRAEKAVSMINTDSNIHTSQNGANTDSTKKEAELDSNEILEDKESDRNADSPTKEMVIHAEPVDTADVTHFYFFAIFFIGSGSVLAILIKKQVASGEIMGSQTRRKDM